MHPLVSDFIHPLPQLGVEVHQTRRFPSQQSAHKVSSYVLDARLDLAFGLRPIRAAQARAETPVPCEVQKHGVPNNLASVIAAQPHRLHPVVEDLLGNRSPLPKGCLVHPQKCSQFLIQRGLRPHAAAGARGARGAPNPPPPFPHSPDAPSPPALACRAVFRIGAPQSPSPPLVAAAANPSKSCSRLG